MIRSCNRSFSAIMCFWINSVTRFLPPIRWLPTRLDMWYEPRACKLIQLEHCFSCKSRIPPDRGSPSRFNLRPQIIRRMLIGQPQLRTVTVALKVQNIRAHSLRRWFMKKLCDTNLSKWHSISRYADAACFSINLLSRQLTRYDQRYRTSYSLLSENANKVTSFQIIQFEFSRPCLT